LSDGRREAYEITSLGIQTVLFRHPLYLGTS
jgi:hypothetical protein